MLNASGSSKTDFAVSKLILCFAILRRFFYSSHSKRRIYILTIPYIQNGTYRVVHIIKAFGGKSRTNEAYASADWFATFYDQ